MPKVPTRCSRLGCSNRAPCREHPRGWASSTSPPLPGNWASLRALVRSRKICAICGSPGRPVDHIVPRAWGGSDSIDNLQLMCDNHHTEKTQEESHWGNKRQIPDLEWWRNRWTAKR